MVAPGAFQESVGCNLSPRYRTQEGSPRSEEEAQFSMSTLNLYLLVQRMQVRSI